MNSSQRKGLTRRSVLTGIAVATAAAATGCSAGSSRVAPSPDALQSVGPGGPGSFGNGGDALLLQVMAHPDDDLYFMNPDARHMVEAGAPVVSVYVTAGESVGQNWVEGMARRGPDKAAYSSARHQGLRQAYAELIGRDKFTPWKKSVMDLPGGCRAEINELGEGRRKARLIFLNIAMFSAGETRLPLLWDRPYAVMQTLVATGSPCRSVSTYHHRTLVDALAAIMEKYRPTVVHTMDPDPDYQVHDATHPKDNDYGACSDHRDHTPTALFTWKALDQWVSRHTRREGHPPRFTTLAFRGYYNQRWPYNLPSEIVDEKYRLVAAYGGDPGWSCGNQGGCGDYGQGGERPLKNRKGWIRSTHYRYPGPTAVAGSDRSGRLEAYGVLGLQAVRWQETSPGSGRWGAPVALGGGPLAPAVASVKDVKGHRLLFALRFSSLEGQGRGNSREITVLEQHSPGGAFKAWKSLGNPEHKAERGRRVGVPAAVATPDGRVHLFVRNAGKGLSSRVREPDGTWGKWQSLHGQEVQEGLSAALDGQGRVHVFGIGRDTVHHWSQEAPGKPVRAMPLHGLPGPGGNQMGAALGADGGLTVVYRTPAAAEPIGYSLGRDGNGAERTGGSGLRSFSGYGPLAAATVPRRGGRDSLMVLGRALSGEIQLVDAEAGDGPVRAPRGITPVGASGLVTDSGHRVCAVGLGPDATPWVWRPAPGSGV
ncbi:PIG-L family deacetylase [Streptomyces sp. UNOB3_S3]|uniref:PIG-L family deacetylase n=1 Tax=Streptomyces sp. UNOB3_S3 TaxID=2871682 RepID=UPI001E4F99A6|nr:PIG-L family deacetylase [Streptomyces sp. UNOB3_S3]MCC3774325.1 PIG-L family deacetylase [Streptomyces sp. UNOB3_S3]